ncbi:MAG: hypothetical protein RJA22_1033 [Verrucomicrobiota bacterium]|jgi:CPA2 family monovalent cation:H+ antiporter-2
MHNVTLLQDLAVVMIVAGLATVLCHRFRQPVVLGYILAGLIIGPHTPPFPLIRDADTIKTLSELGVVLLMFSLGLEFNLRKLRQVGAAAFLAAALEIVLMVLIGYEIGRLFGWSPMDSLFLGAMLSISSTTIIVKALAELGRSRERFAELIFGILVIEDILAIVMIALLSGIAMTGSLTPAEVGTTVGRLSIYLAAALVLGLIAVPRLLGYVARFRSNEMLLITVLGLCFGFALLAAKLQYSVALGAFIIGAVIAEAREIHRIEILTEPIRDMFSAIFFVSIGLMLDPRLLAQYAVPVAVITAAVVVGKVVTCSFGAFLGGQGTLNSLRVGLGLAQIGEFSFIIAALGLSLKVTSDFLYPVAVAVSVLTTLLTPYLIRSADGLGAWVNRHAPPSLLANLELYTRWVGQRREGPPASFASRLVRRWMAVMGLNMLLAAGLFAGAAFLAQRPPAWIPAWGETYRNAILWLIAMTLSLPLLIATFRKLQALGLLVAETRISEAAAGERTLAIRGIVAQGIPLAGLAGMGLLVLALSSAILPPTNVLVMLLVVTALIAWLLWRSFIRVYSKAQIALQETFAQEPEPAPAASAPLPALLRDAHLETVLLPPDSAAAGQRLREVQLRSATGASVVGIDRQGSSIVNPGPEETLQPGDQLLLLGHADQLQAARSLLAQARPRS